MAAVTPAAGRQLRPPHIPPLPAFNEQGRLPGWVINTSWEDVVARFGFNDPRRTLIENTEAALAQVQWPEGRRMRLYGSFITSKKIPHDIDVGLPPGTMSFPRQADLSRAWQAKGVQWIRETENFNLYGAAFHYDRNGIQNAVLEMDVPRLR